MEKRREVRVWGRGGGGEVGIGGEVNFGGSGEREMEVGFGKWRFRRRIVGKKRDSESG